MLRIYVLYDRQRKLLYANITLFLAEIAATLVVILREYGKTKGMCFPSP